MGEESELWIDCQLDFHRIEDDEQTMPVRVAGRSLFCLAGHSLVVCLAAAAEFCLLAWLFTFGRHSLGLGVGAQIDHRIGE